MVDAKWATEAVLIMKVATTYGITIMLQMFYINCLILSLQSK